jgi:serine/threonine protein phosphatase PrpC
VCTLIKENFALATIAAQYTAAARTDRGRKRSSNEDAFGYSIEDGIYLVCDGMGGAAAGEVASSLAVEEVLRLVAERRAGDYAAGQNGAGQDRSDQDRSAATLAAEVVHSANAIIHERSRRNPRLHGMGTTLVGILVEGSQAHIVHTGDSRCYLLRAGRLERLTEDHSLVEEEMRKGRMTAAEAARSPLRNVITRALGTQNEIEPEVSSLPVEPADLFLLCSDGLSRELSDDRMQELLNTGLTASGQLEELCAELIEAANKAGGHDNITCLLIRAETL